jgi:radical SAM superfamily enzyme
MNFLQSMQRRLRQQQEPVNNNKKYASTKGFLYIRNYTSTYRMIQMSTAASGTTVNTTFVKLQSSVGSVNCHSYWSVEHQSVL